MLGKANSAMPMCSVDFQTLTLVLNPEEQHVVFTSVFLESCLKDPLCNLDNGLLQSFKE